MEGLIHVLWIAGAASMAFTWSRMGLFGGPSREELDAVAAERDELKKKLERAEVRVEEQKKKVGRLQTELEEAAAETKEVRRRAAEHRDECRKLQRQLEQTEARIQRAPAELQARLDLLAGLQEEVGGLRARGAQLAADLEEARQQVSSLERDRERLKRALEAETERAAAVGAEAPPTAGVGAEAPPAAGVGALDDGLKAKLRELKESLRIKEGLLHKIRAQAEHNRRAYVITQLQLELAHDEVYELKHGKPRRDTERSRRQRPAAFIDPESVIELEPESEEVSATATASATAAEFDIALGPESGPEDIE
ncbi:MAG: hypothetical protein ABIK09_05085 [Pseudomonadota bacterium]